MGLQDVVMPGVGLLENTASPSLSTLQMLVDMR